MSLSGTDAVDGQLLSLLERMSGDGEAPPGQPVYPQMGREQARIETFRPWPANAPVRPETLVMAGFFYTGHNDNVKCFHCDGSLRNWESGDDPWREHARWFPRCGFLLRVRGQEYVSFIQRSQLPADSSCPRASAAASPTTANSSIRAGRGNLSPEQQLRQLQEERTCKVCLDKPVSIVFMPCGHLVVCGDCAASLQHCPVCRALIRSSVRAFMS